METVHSSNRMVKVIVSSDVSSCLLYKNKYWNGIVSKQRVYFNILSYATFDRQVKVEK